MKIQAKTQAKSLQLAELMRYDEFTPVVRYCEWHPYDKSVSGLAQFAAILLKYIHLLPSFEQEHDQCGKWMPFEPTQESLLDCILRMNGVEA